MKSSDSNRKTHAALGTHSPNVKTQKTERLLDLVEPDSIINILGIGAGAGFIAHYFAHCHRLQCNIDSVEISYQRQTQDRFQFDLVNDSSLSFPNESFDVVITNHVIGHGGDLNSQRHHPTEVQRVMRRKGIGYLAVPNRRMLFEPNYRLAFLNWLPPSRRTPHLRAVKRDKKYDCDPPSLYTLESLMTDTQLAYENLTSQTLRQSQDIEGSKGRLSATISTLPAALLDKLAHFNPTMIYKPTRACAHSSQ